MTSLRAIAEGHRRSEDAGEDLPADEEAEREIHVRRGNATQGAEDQDADSAKRGRSTSRCRVLEAMPSAGRLH